MGGFLATLVPFALVSAFLLMAVNFYRRSRKPGTVEDPRSAHGPRMGTLFGVLGLAVASVLLLGLLTNLQAVTWWVALLVGGLSAAFGLVGAGSFIRALHKRPHRD